MASRQVRAERVGWSRQWRTRLRCPRQHWRPRRWIEQKSSSERLQPRAHSDNSRSGGTLDMNVDPSGPSLSLLPPIHSPSLLLLLLDSIHRECDEWCTRECFGIGRMPSVSLFALLSFLVNHGVSRLSCRNSSRPSSPSTLPSVTSERRASTWERAMSS